MKRLIRALRFPVFNFLGRLFSKWSSTVTGSLSATLFIYGAITNGVPRYLALGFANFCLFWAAGLVWHEENQRAEKIQAELDDERSAKNAPDLGLELNPAGELILHNRSHDKDVHNIALRSNYTLEAPFVPFLMRGVTMPLHVTHHIRPGEGTLWDRQPYALEPFPPNSIKMEMPLFLEFMDRQGSVIYVAEFRIVFNRLGDTSVRQIGVTTKSGGSPSGVSSRV